MKKCPFVDYRKDYKAIAKEVAGILAGSAIIAIFLCWCVYMA